MWSFLSSFLVLIMTDKPPSMIRQIGSQYSEQKSLCNHLETHWVTSGCIITLVYGDLIWNWSCIPCNSARVTPSSLTLYQNTQESRFLRQNMYFLPASIRVYGTKVIAINSQVVFLLFVIF